jgi:lipopolysaccharide assembly protein A
MRLLIWLFRAFVFFTLFAFALNNQQVANVHWFFGVQWQAPMVIVVLIAFAAGSAVGVLAMVPSWWRHRRQARRQADLVPAAAKSAPAANSQNSVLPSEFGADQIPRVGL